MGLRRGERANRIKMSIAWNDGTERKKCLTEKPTPIIYVYNITSDGIGKGDGLEAVFCKRRPVIIRDTSDGETFLLIGFDVVDLAYSLKNEKPAHLPSCCLPSYHIISNYIQSVFFKLKSHFHFLSRISKFSNWSITLQTTSCCWCNMLFVTFIRLNSLIYYKNNLKIMSKDWYHKDATRLKFLRLL